MPLRPWIVEHQIPTHDSIVSATVDIKGISAPKQKGAAKKVLHAPSIRQTHSTDALLSVAPLVPQVFEYGTSRRIAKEVLRHHKPLTLVQRQLVGIGGSLYDSGGGEGLYHQTSSRLWWSRTLATPSPDMDDETVRSFAQPTISSRSPCKRTLLRSKLSETVVPN